MSWGAIAEHVEFKIMYRVNDEQCMNVLHYRVEGSSAGGEPHELTQGLLDDFTVGNGDPLLDAMQQCMSEDVTINQITCQGIWPIRYRMQTRLINRPGAQAGPTNAQNLAAVITKYGQLGDRHNLGAFHLGAQNDNQIAEGLIKDAQILRLEDLAVELLTSLSDTISEADYTPVILNKDPIPNTDPVRYQIIGSSNITDVSVKDTVRTMRRRTKRVGI